MNKELNPNLFPPEGGTRSGETTAAASSPKNESVTTWNLAAGPTASNLQEFRENERDKELKLLRQKVRDYENRISDLESKMSDLTRATSLRTERMSQRLAQLETSLGQKADELHDKMAQTMGKVHERRLTESKIEEMVDRHNNLVRSFETRLAQLTRALSEREIQLMNIAAVNEEARRELARLKRL